MDSNSNNTKSIKRKAVDQLVEGYEFTTQLQLLLSHQHSKHHIDQTRIVSGSDSVSGELDPVDELIAKILGSFHKTISVLDSFDPVAVSVPIAVEGSWNASCGDDSATPVSCNGRDSGESRKRLGVGKGKRGCYIRKKRSNTRIVEARSSEDAYAWRKYGQKDILNTEFPRSYFRCTHKPTQGCTALKKVQKLGQDPDMFQITYIGYHTCTATDQTHAKAESFDHEIIMDSDNTLAATTTQDHVNAKVQDPGMFQMTYIGYHTCTATDQTHAKAESFDHETTMDSDNTLAATTTQDHVNAKVQEQQNSSNLTVVGTSMVKEEENNNGENKEYCEASSTCEDLSLVWNEMMMFDDHQQQHQNHYYCGETSTTSHRFAFSDNDQLSSFFESYCA